MEPLESTSIHLIQSGIIRLISLFPDRSFSPALSQEYNRQSTIEFERIRDFLVLHYRANAKPDSPFWRMCQDLPLSDHLARKLALYQDCGRIHRESDELFTEAGWLQVMCGQGLAPTAFHPLANALQPTQLMSFLNDLDRVIGRAIDPLPDHDAFIRRFLSNSSVT
jgi:tryptophan halogenase